MIPVGQLKLLLTKAGLEILVAEQPDVHSRTGI
jgi:hypothetical protein